MKISFHIQQIYTDIYIYIYIHNIYIYIIYNIYIYLYLYKWSQMSHDIYKLYSIEDTIFPRECDWIARNLNLSRFFYTLHFFLTHATNAEMFWTDATHAIHSKVWPTPPPNHPGYLRYPLYLSDSTRDCISCVNSKIILFWYTLWLCFGYSTNTSFHQPLCLIKQLIELILKNRYF